MKRRFSIKEFVNIVRNKTTNQYTYVLKKKALKNIGLSPKSLLNVKFILKKRKLKW